MSIIEKDVADSTFVLYLSRSAALFLFIHQLLLVEVSSLSNSGKSSALEDITLMQIVL
jgi:hypothetical protein